MLATTRPRGDGTRGHRWPQDSYGRQDSLDGAPPEAERNVIRLRFGLAGEEPQTLRETGSQLGITAERARQLEMQGLRRLARNPELESLRIAA